MTYPESLQHCRVAKADGAIAERILTGARIVARLSARLVAVGTSYQRNCFQLKLS